MRSLFFTATTAATAILLAAGVSSSSSVAAQETTSHSTHDHGGDEEGSSQESYAAASHGGEHFEAAAVYDVEAGTNSFVAFPAAAAAGIFGEESFAFMIVPAASADEEGLEGAEEDAEAAWDAYLDGAEPTVLASGESSTPSADVVYQIALEGPLVVVPIEVVGAGAYAIFLEHGADEVGTALVSPSGAVLVAAAEEGAAEEEEEGEDSGSATASQWANGIVASLVVSACSLTGLLVVINKNVANSIGLSHAFIFASGALLTASLLHIIPEAMEGLESEFDSLHDLGLYAGLAILGGMSFGMVIHALLESGHSYAQGDLHHHAVGIMGAGGSGAGVAGENGLMPQSQEIGDKAPAQGSSLGAQQKSDMVQGPVDVTQPSSPAEMTSHDSLRELIAARQGKSLLDLKGLQPVCWNIIAGDLVHNFADGVSIGAAFLGCGTTMGWTVTAAAVLHEVPHEVADFMALLNGGMSLKQAFVYNFLSALSAVLGTIIILALGDTLSDAQISIVLLLGAGSFIFIALSELLPEALLVTDATTKHGGRAVLCSQLRKLASFLVGGVVVGIPLLFDEHCSVGGDGHDH